MTPEPQDYSFPAIYMTDFYKFGHIHQYAKGTTQVWSNYTCRSSRTDRNDVVFFGLQYNQKKIMSDFARTFFGIPLKYILEDYRAFVTATLGIQNPYTEHIEQLWNYGRLPIDVYALPEGDTVPIKVPVFVVTNTQPWAFWVPNYLETITSARIWKAITSATTAQTYRRIFEKHARRAGEQDLSFINWQGHDFAERGLSGLEDIEMSGMGHLTSFSGTDTVPAIWAAKNYYGADFTVGGSVPATEHSVMCSGEQSGEFEMFKRLLTEIYPSGIVSIVSDTWDLWKVLTEYVPALKETILARDGKIVIRPDSGDPEWIICGNHMIMERINGLDTSNMSPAQKGTLRLLAEALGTVPGGGRLPMINKGGAIYGDSITPQVADTILTRMVDELQISPFNMVFGIGSYTYEYTTRDTYGQAMKATAIRRSLEPEWPGQSEIVDIFKNPVTDTGGVKKSLKGIPAVYRSNGGDYYATDGNKPEALDHCAYRKVTSDGFLVLEDSFSDIRKRAQR